MPYRELTDEQLAKAKEMLDSGASVAETSRATGISVTTLYKRFKGSADPKPGGRTKPKPSRPKATDEQLQTMLTKAAVAPAVPAGLWLKCDYCAAHFVTTGPQAATKLVELSHDEPALRSVLEWLHGYWQQAAWAGLLATWLGVPIAHHLAPDWIYRWLQLPMGLPPRNGDAPGHAHVHTPPPANGNVTDSAPPFANPFGGMDVDSLLAMAEQFGIKIEMPTFDDTVIDADATEAAPESSDEATDADSTAPPETASTDSDAV